MMNQTNHARLEIAQQALNAMPIARREKLDCLIKDKLRREIERGALPPASGYHVVLVIDDREVVHLGAELTDSTQNVIAGPFSIGPLDLGLARLEEAGKALIH
jgi:hypothetical protein